jgi:hypothetical protein
MSRVFSAEILRRIDGLNPKRHDVSYFTGSAD